ncbi:RNA polymerase sigma factor [Planctomycetes bacterium K23_9]|uniref:RNA polymerase sigma factor n=1 Tax=Stieleria marina TaxID=1930275 RepID=A0A517NVT6_9BACT|nr:RNA polymerase sigma factor [Planctomycetes bacterium K23_9]
MALPQGRDEGRLSQIQTNWTEVFGSCNEQPSVASQAQRDLLVRYAGPVYRYLRGAVRDPDVADDLAQEFAFRIVRGDFRNANPGRGRFRDFIKRALRNLVTDYFRKQNKRPASLSPQMAQIADASSPVVNDDFDHVWRKELLSQTWNAMDEADQASGTCYALVLRERAQNPAFNSSDLAVKISDQLSREVNAAWARQTLRRARVRFAELLRKEVAKTLGVVSDENVDGELGELGLLKYTR